MGVVQRGDKTEVKQAPGHPPGQELEMKWSLPSISHVMERSGCRGKRGLRLTATVGAVTVCLRRLVVWLGGLQNQRECPQVWCKNAVF